MKARLPWVGGGLVFGALLWLPLTSVALCIMLGTVQRMPPVSVPLAAWFYWRDYGDLPVVAHWLPLCAVAAGMAALAPALLVLSWPESHTLRVARPGQRPPPPRR